MKISQIKKVLGAEMILGEDCLEKEVEMACGSDLMSDVLTFIKQGSLLLTGLTNSQVIRTAEMAEVNVVCFVRGKQPQQETVKLAEEKGMILLSTTFPMHESCGRLYAAGLCGCTECDQ